ncbi:hypothetical protein J2Y54_000793 [Sphingomonas sp. BE123]|uniref:hypothetical protein n=1 Tax=Sphingomonas sp. BE123 TaxID=2817842 RepID=UPI002854BD0F|nr:hypothetical protein [Sphingomonas sp. BE123]MDR6851300.1 hypothetical protein [Sphingomonas sp. BE123]
MVEQAKTGSVWRNPWRLIGWGGIAVLMLTPAVAMQFTDEVNWTVGDFIFAFLMLGSVGLAVELTVRANPAWSYRAGVGIMLAVSFLTVWINLAVGIVGNEDNPVNALFFLAPLAAVAGSVLGGFRAGGMVIATILAAMVQIAVMLYIWVAGAGFPIGVTVFFSTLWLVAAGLFRQAARR